MIGKELTTNQLRFVLGGKSTFTIVSGKTEARYTFRVVARKDNTDNNVIHFVSVLRGADNDKDYTYMGCILNKKKFVLTGKSKVSKNSTSYLAFLWFFNRLVSGKGLGDKVKFFHAGKCARCGRKLTVPSSIETGFGPECSKFAFGGE